MNTDIFSKISATGLLAALTLLAGATLSPVDVRADSAFTIVESDGSTDVSEDGGTDTFTIALSNSLQPGVELTYNWAGSIDPFADVTATPSSLVFNSSNWDVPQTVTVSAIDDAQVEGDELATILFELAGATGLGSLSEDIETFTGDNPDAVNVNVTDNDGMSVTDIPSEIESDQSYTASLTLDPSPLHYGEDTENVTVTITPPNGVNVSPDTLVFETVGASSVLPIDINLSSNPVSSQNFTITHAGSAEIITDFEGEFLFSASGQNTTYFQAPDITASTTVRATDHNSSRSNKTSSSCATEDIVDGEDNDCDGVECDITVGTDQDCLGYPNGGDANNDGLQDNTQNNVTLTRNENVSISLEVDQTIQEISQRKFTKELDKSTPILARAGLAIDDVLSFTTFAFETDVELVLYTDSVTDNEGNTVSIEDVDAGNLRAAKVNPDTGEVAIIEDAVVSIQVIDGQEVIKIEYDVVDGGPLDEDDINGSITDPVGLLYVGDDTDTDTDGLIRTGGKGYKISPVLLTLSGIFMICMVIKYAINE